MYFIFNISFLRCKFITFRGERELITWTKTYTDERSM